MQFQPVRMQNKSALCLWYTSGANLVQMRFRYTDTTHIYLQANILVSIFIILAYQQRMADYNIYNINQVYKCGKKHGNFEDFYYCHCRMLHRYRAELYALYRVGGLLLKVHTVH